MWNFSKKAPSAHLPSKRPPGSRLYVPKAWANVCWTLLALCACEHISFEAWPDHAADAGESMPSAGTKDAGTGGTSHFIDGGRPGGTSDGGTADDAAFPAETTSAFEAFQWDGYRYWLFRPSNLPAGEPAPLVMMLHGCQQRALEFKEDTALTELAETEKFWVVFPEQKLNQHPLRCWRWYDSAHQQREVGEPAALRGIVADIRSRHAIDAQRIYVGGLSAGAAMTAILTTIYSDVFRKGFALAGLPFQAARSELEIEGAMRNGVPDPAALGRVAFQSMYPGADMAPLFVMHGDADGLVDPINGEHLITQWTTCADLYWDGVENQDVEALSPQEISADDASAHDAVLRKYLLPSGELIAASLWVDALGHKWPGANSGNPHTDDMGPSATHWMWDFFNGTMP